MLAFILVFWMDILRDNQLVFYLKRRLAAERWCQLCYSPKSSFQILHAMGKIPEDEIWQSEPESVVGYFLFHEFLNPSSLKAIIYQKNHL